MLKLFIEPTMQLSPGLADSLLGLLLTVPMNHGDKCRQDTLLLLDLHDLSCRLLRRPDNICDLKHFYSLLHGRTVVL